MVKICVYKFQQAIDNEIELERRKVPCSTYFFDGMISQTKYNETKNYIESIDRDLFNGYFGEVLFYIIKNSALKVEKIMIEPSRPKTNSKQPGLDYVEIRKNEDDYYFIIGEIKTTDKTIRSYPDEIIDFLINRPVHLIYQEINAFKERIRYTGPEDLKNFINRMPIYFANKILQHKKICRNN